jgi:hypothetical protein
MGARGPWHAGGVHGWRGASVEHLDSCLTGVARAFFNVRSSSAEQWEQFEGQQRAANDGLPRENLDATSDLALPRPSVIWPAAGTNQGAYRAGRYIILTSLRLDLVDRTRKSNSSSLVDILVGTYVSSGEMAIMSKVRVARDTPCIYS